MDKAKAQDGYSFSEPCDRCKKTGWVDLQESSKTFGLCMTCRLGRREGDENVDKYGDKAVIPTKPETGIVRYETAVQAELVTDRRTAEEMSQLVADLVIDSQENLELAADVLAEAKGAYRALEEKKRQVTDPLTTALTQVREWFKPAQSFYVQIEATLKRKIGEYNTQVAKHNERALREAADQAAAGNVAATEGAIEQIVVTEKVQGLSVREAWTFEVYDPSSVPRNFLVVSEPLLQEHIRASKGAPMPVPGVRFFKKAIISSRAK